MAHNISTSKEATFFARKPMVSTIEEKLLENKQSYTHRRRQSCNTEFNNRLMPRDGISLSEDYKVSFLPPATSAVSQANTKVGDTISMRSRRMTANIDETTIQDFAEPPTR